MKLKLEIEAEDALELCKLHAALMEVGAENMGHSPLEYSTAARITNDFFAEVVRKLPMDEFERIRSKDEESD